MRIVALLLAAFAVCFSVFGSASVVHADPNGTQSLHTVPYGGFVTINVSGLEPGVLTVSHSTGFFDAWEPVNAGLNFANSSGRGTILFTPIYAVDRSYQGPIWIQVCDSKGSCIIFQITVGGSHPMVVGKVKQDPICVDLQALLNGAHVGGIRFWYLELLGHAGVEAMARDCGFQHDQVKRILDRLFDD